MIKPVERKDDVKDTQSNWSEDSEAENYSESQNGDISKDKQKFKQLKESKRRFLNEFSEGPIQGDMKQRMDVLVKKAESLANFLLTKHQFKE